MDVPIDGPQRAIQRVLLDDRMDVPLTYRLDDPFRREDVSLDAGGGTPDFEGVVRITAADERDGQVLGEFVGASLILGVLPVDFDGVDVDAGLVYGVIPEGMWDDRHTVAVVRDGDGRFGRQFPPDGRRRRVGTDDQQMAVRRRYLDTGNDDGSGVEPVPAIVVIRDRETVEVTTPGHRRE